MHARRGAPFAGHRCFVFVYGHVGPINLAPDVILALGITHMEELVSFYGVPGGPRRCVPRIIHVGVGTVDENRRMWPSLLCCEPSIPIPSDRRIPLRLQRHRTIVIHGVYRTSSPRVAGTFLEKGGVSLPVVN